MRRINLLVALVLIATALVSCEESRSHATLRVNLQKDRSIVPSGYPLEISKYRLTGDGPGSESFSIETSRESVSLEGLVIGEWIIYAEGLNSIGDILVTGETTHYLSSTNGSCTIVMEDLVGEGTLEVYLSWDPERISEDVSIEMEIVPQYGNKESESLILSSFDAASGTASYIGEGYPAGSYILAARLYDGSVQVAGFVEAVRIAGNQVSEGEITFDLDKYPTEPGMLELVNNTGIPVVCYIDGIEDTVEASIPITVSITCETDEVSGFQIAWYLDGSQIGEGPSVEFTPLIGTHRLDVVASASRLGTTGSASVNFEAISASTPGVPVQGNVIESSSDLPLSGYTDLRFLPDGNVMISSNTERTIQIAKIIRNDLDAVRSYTFDSIGIDGTVVDFEPLYISSSMTKIIMSQENPYKVIVFNYNPITATLTKFSEGTPVYYRYPDEEEIAGIGAVAVTDGIMKDGYGVGAVMVKRASTGKWQQNYVSFGAGTGDSGYFWQGSDFGIGNAVTPVGRLQGSDECFFMTSREGQLFHPAKHWRNDEIFALEAHFDTYTLEEATAAKLNGLTTGAMIDPDHYIVIGDYISVLEYDPAADNWGWIIHSSEEVTHEASSLTISPDGSYAYYIDIDADEIVTLEIAEDGRSVEEIGRTALSGNGIDTLSLSPSGMNIIAFDESDASEVTVMRVSR